MSNTYHNLNSREVLKELNTTEKGLTETEAKKRLEKQGFNELTIVKKITLFEIFLSQFKNIMVLMLVFATIISFLIGEIVDAIVILIILLINALLGFVQEYKAEKAMEALLDLASPHAVVIREGKEKNILSKFLVKGDIVVLNVGDLVPANLRLIQGIGLKVDQSHLTGESISIEKTTQKILKETPLSDRKNIIYSSSTITYGKGVGIVIATGMETEIGIIAKNVQETENEETPLQREVNKLAKALAVIVIILITTVFFIGLLFNHDLAEMFLTSVSLGVAAVPEGLPAVITVTLALGMQKMAKKNAVVRKLSAVQTLGNVTVICSDKTGTLTKNEMTVTNIFDGEKDITVTGTGYDTKGEFLFNNTKVEAEELGLLFEIGALCNNAYLNIEGNNTSIIGDPTEASLLVLAGKAGVDYLKIKKDKQEIAEISFDSKRKRMSTVLKHENHALIYTKGAPDILLNLCSKIYSKGNEIKLTKEVKKKILEKNEEYAGKALRVLALAYKKIKQADKYTEDDESELVFVGLVGMIDPPRLEVKTALNKCRSAGIRVMMLTGDYITTAKSVGKSIGLLESNDLALTSQELDRMSDDEFRKAVKQVNVFARISPENKLRIVEELKKQGEIVAVTGDGVNDAPALKSAHIGIAMGITGTDVSKEASEIVLTDDNFSTIVNAVEQGRIIFNNIKKFIRFLLSANSSTITVILISIIIGLPLPYIPIHILWLNLITDGVPALALSVDPSKNVMKEKPRNPEKTMIKEFGVFILSAGIISAVAAISLFIISLNIEGYFLNGSELSIAKSRTIAITSAILFELLFVFNCRDDKKSVWELSVSENFLSNKFLTISVIISIILQLIFIYSPFFNYWFKTVPLLPFELGLAVLFGSLGLLVIPRLFNHDFNKKSETN